MLTIKNIQKILRFSAIYGLRRTIIKALARTRLPKIKYLYFSFNKTNRDISIIGCGQYSFSTILFFLAQEIGNRFLYAYDIDSNAAKSLVHFYRFTNGVNDVKAIFEKQTTALLYIASNHYTHTSYAIKGMQSGIKKIYVEKPLAVTEEQLISFLAHRKKFNTHTYLGYNRPYSKTFVQLKKHVTQDRLSNIKQPFTINYSISGHKIPKDHWYRNVEEGTRICGNVGHWLDSTIHILAWRELPKSLDITII